MRGTDQGLIQATTKAGLRGFLVGACEQHRGQVIYETDVPNLAMDMKNNKLVHKQVLKGKQPDPKLKRKRSWTRKNPKQSTKAKAKTNATLIFKLDKVSVKVVITKKDRQAKFNHGFTTWKTQSARFYEVANDLLDHLRVSPQIHS